MLLSLDVLLSCWFTGNTVRILTSMWCGWLNIPSPLCFWFLLRHSNNDLTVGPMPGILYQACFNIYLFLLDVWTLLTIIIILDFVMSFFLSFFLSFFRCFFNEWMNEWIISFFVLSFFVSFLLFVCLSFCLSVCLFIYLSACLPACMCVCLYVLLPFVCSFVHSFLVSLLCLIHTSGVAPGLVSFSFHCLASPGCLAC